MKRGFYKEIETWRCKNGSEQHVTHCHIISKCALPIVDIVGLIPAGNPDCFILLNDLSYTGIVGSGARWDDKRCDGVRTRAELLDIRVVGVSSSCPDHQKIAAATPFTHPLESCVHVGSAAHHHRPWRGLRGDVICVANPEVGVLLGRFSCQ